ncbi:hypothetical protein BJX99DRAFT_228884 [Aspergillus californicus]
MVSSAWDIGYVIDQVEVLAAGFTNNLGELLVCLLANAFANLRVDGLEDARGANKVKASKVVVG